MKNKKLLALIAAVLLLMMSFAPAASALSSIFGESSGQLMDILGEILGGEDGSINLSDLGDMDLSALYEQLKSIMQSSGVDLSEIAQAIQTMDISSIPILSDGSFSAEFLDTLRSYLSNEEPTTAEPTTEAPTTKRPEPTTQPITTQPPTTAAPVVEVQTTIVYVYQGSQTYVVPSTTQPPEEMYTYNYIEPSTVVVPEITTQNYTPIVIEDTTSASERTDGFSVKSIIGIGLLVLSLVAVIVVAVILKKNKI